MKASKFLGAQKAFILKLRAEGVPVADICRKSGISQATDSNWKKKYDGLLSTEMRRLKLLEDESCQSARKVGPGVECTPVTGHDQAAVLSLARVCWSSN